MEKEREQHSGSRPNSKNNICAASNKISFEPRVPAEKRLKNPEYRIEKALLALTCGRTQGLLSEMLIDLHPLTSMSPPMAHPRHQWDTEWSKHGLCLRPPQEDKTTHGHRDWRLSWGLIESIT